MSGRLRVLVPALLFVGVVVASVVLAGGFGPGSTRTPAAARTDPARAAGSNGLARGALNPEPTPRPPLGGTELYGYLPYWEMNDAAAGHLARRPADDPRPSSPSAPAATGERTPTRRATSGSPATSGGAYRRGPGPRCPRRAGVHELRSGAERDLLRPGASGTRDRAERPRADRLAPTAAAPTGASSTNQPSGSPQPAAPPYARTVHELVALAVEPRRRRHQRRRRAARPSRSRGLRRLPHRRSGARSAPSPRTPGQRRHRGRASAASATPRRPTRPGSIGCS